MVVLRAHRLLIVLLLFFSTLKGQEESTVQDSIALKGQEESTVQDSITTYGVVVMDMRHMSDVANEVELQSLINSFIDAASEELEAMDSLGVARVIPTDELVSAIFQVTEDGLGCQDNYCVRQVAELISMDKIILIDLSEIKAEATLGQFQNFSGKLTLSLGELGLGKDIDTGQDISIMMTERTFSKKLKGDLEELMVRIRSRTWVLMEKTPPEERFPPEPFTFEISQLILYIENSPALINIALGVLFVSALSAYLLSRPPVIGDPPSYPEIR